MNPCLCCSPKLSVHPIQGPCHYSNTECEWTTLTGGCTYTHLPYDTPSGPRPPSRRKSESAQITSMPCVGGIFAVALQAPSVCEAVRGGVDGEARCTHVHYYLPDRRQMMSAQTSRPCLDVRTCKTPHAPFSGWRQTTRALRGWLKGERRNRGEVFDDLNLPSSPASLRPISLTSGAAVATRPTPMQ